VYDLREREPETEQTYVVRHELVDPRDNVLPTTVDTVRSASGEWIKVSSFDLSKLSMGEYTLRAIVEHPASGAEAVGERTFSLLWKNAFWAMTEQDVLDEARVLFQEDEYDRFQAMSSGDRAQYVEEFWQNADPTPGTSRNELREEFMRRVRYANGQFQSQGKGMLSDRGRLYIRFGEPDEIQRELLPTGDRQLDQQVEKLTEENISGSLLATNDVIDTRPYEIWIYTRQGAPLFPERERTTTVTGLRFVFVDETGTGHYVLRYSSDFIGY
jgi:GWxTD domain-containing protein